MPDSAAIASDLSMPLTETYPEIREAVAKLCEGFQGEYWREKDQVRGYPTEFVQACEARISEHAAKGGYPAAIQDAEVACWDEPCDAIMECLSLVYSQRAVAEARFAIDDAHARGDERALVQACLRAPESERERCNGVLRERLEAQADRAKVAVTEGRSGAALCEDMTTLARFLGDPESTTAADQSCALTTAADAVANATEALARGAGTLPANCRSAVLQLERQTEAWAKAQSAEVVRACYAELAIDILRRELPGLRGECPHALVQAWTAVRRHAVEDHSLGKLRAKAKRLCSGAVTGVPECDTYIVDYTECIETKYPEASREVSRKALQTSIDAWKIAATTKAGREGLGAACREVTEIVGASCGW